MRLVTCTPMAWESDHRDFTNRVNDDAVGISAFECPIRDTRAADIRPERSRPHSANDPHAGRCR
jgi:hypothetical protein